MSGEPFSKEQQLARGERRYHRKVASPKRWQAIADAKQGLCIVCGAAPPNELHHIVSRAQNGADTESNIVPLCQSCHSEVTRRNPHVVEAFVAALDGAEYAYAVEHGGEGFFERAYGLRFARPEGRAS